MAACTCALVHMSGSSHRTPFVDNFKVSLSTSFTPLLTTLQQNLSRLRINSPYKSIREASVRMLDAFVDLMFEFVDDPRQPSQSNFAPVEETGEPVEVIAVEGEIPADFTEGVYIRNGANPVHGGLKSAVSIFGKTSCVWIEGEGMLHAVYFKREASGNWTITYNNRYVETETYLLEKEKNRPYILPAIEGNPSAVLMSFLLNSLRIGTPNKLYSNTSIIEHAGAFYSVAENHCPQKIDIRTLETLGNWSIGGAWTRPFTSHPKKAPGSGELVIIGTDAKKPYIEVGVVSADGTKLVHKVDLKFERSIVSHEIGVTQRYNVILNFPIILDVNRVLKGGSLIKYEEGKYSSIGVMPRYGNSDSVLWFPVETGCVYHLINCYENGDDEVVVMGCKARESFIPGPDFGLDKFEWFSRGLKHVDECGENMDQDGKLFSRAYEWRLNMKTGEVKEGYLTGTEFAVDFPLINPKFTGIENKYAYTQVVDSTASAAAGIVKYSGLAKLFLHERHVELSRAKVEYHMFPANTYCSGAAFVSKSGATEEDDGWIIAFVHDEDTDNSQVYIVDAKNISGELVAKIGLQSRVPYGFHGIFSSFG
ncbi:carotenoid 9,10(9',10')-cleavage dioxygenase-like [Andrographis paniculata]|uniref:carotenoid 9,10(9',10')-cleavage dioxygenase-like n=1 Tax=Andrographis paniculata TaxID=175694 RepID=UPI0021E7A385|nr:carotenoid 9,10(9',10')-cleavage dioxygenase-like [Andrographis paniculata]